MSACLCSVEFSALHPIAKPKEKKRKTKQNNDFDLIEGELMGYCGCFGPRKKGDKLGIEDKSRYAEEPVKQESSPQKVQTNADIKAQIFTFQDLSNATNKFREERFIGRGGFGAVYRGKLESTGQVVAIKQLDHSGFQGEKEFLVEVLMLSLMYHSNLVKLIGYCAEEDQRLLVYEYMPLGSLEDHLLDIRPDQEPLDWNTRMMIAAGSAKGLAYLHNEADPPVIYRDLKSANILLGDDFHPKLSDFGLAKFGPTGDKSHVSTRVMGTHGYCAPEYAKTGKLTTKSDIFSFGVVLLEILTGQPAMDETRGRERMLVDWARTRFKDKNCISLLADPLLKGGFSESIFKKVLEVAFMCTNENPALRPSIKDAVRALDYLASHRYEPNETKKVRIKEPEEHSSPNEKLNMLDKDLERERAVAEAKLWGETLREQRLQNVQNNQDVLDSWANKIHHG
ncbi:hypothetical protein Ddye_004660 [Dipteronia dyeriana]|uniref:Protein kinase domain-containing protein n=1 Tax=Dipteronia dyeriana TaxID=168575 RepID=A0AAE0CWJ3_9ROSI|nr:hypothetical protein Ddye_004660 [Dipteronia dyeriana]